MMWIVNRTDEEEFHQFAVQEPIVSQSPCGRVPEIEGHGSRPRIKDEVKNYCRLQEEPAGKLNSEYHANT